MSKPGTLIHISQQMPRREDSARYHHQGHTDWDVTLPVLLTLASAYTRSSRILLLQRQSNQQYASVAGRGCVCPCTQVGWLEVGPRSPRHHLHVQPEVKTQTRLCGSPP